MTVIFERKWTGTDVDIGESFRSASRLAQENKTVLLTAVGVAGVISSNVLSARAGFKAAELIFEEESDRLDGDPQYPGYTTREERIKLAWVLYIPPVGVGALTIAAIILANRLDAQKAAGLAAAYSLSERAFTEYREKVVEKIGENKEQAVRDEIAKDRVDRNPVKEVIIAGAGEVLCLDALTGRYFMASVEAVRKAENEINREILNHMYDSLSHFYELVGLPPTAFSDHVGWNLENHCEVTFSTQISSDDRPCMVIDFRVAPMEGYAKLHM